MKKRELRVSAGTVFTALEPVPAAAQRLGVDLFAVVEQDMCPCPPDKPLPIAVRTRTFLRS